VEADGLPAGLDRHQRLPLALLVVGDEGGGRVEDRLGRAVVLLQPQDPGSREVPLEVQDVLDVRAAPGIDRLVLVPHDGDVPLRAHQVADQLVLRAVGVLVFVHEHVAEAPPVGLPHGLVGQQVHRPQQQVVEVHRLGLAQRGLVALGHPGQDLRAHRVPVEVLQVPARVLAGRDPGEEPPRGMELLREVEGLERVPHDRELVVFVVDDEVRGEAGGGRLPAQEPHAEAVERGDPALQRGPPEEALRAGLHLPRRLVRERDREQGLGRDALLEDEVGDAVGDDAGLAAPCAGQDQHRPVGGQHGDPLLLVQPLEQRRIHQRKNHRDTETQRKGATTTKSTLAGKSNKGCSLCLRVSVVVLAVAAEVTRP
jgi:hypothetical protein